MILLAAALLLIIAPVVKGCRDRFLEPFSSTSIWNTAIGSLAEYEHIGLFKTDDRAPTQFHNDQDFIVRATESDPIVEWVDQGDWGSDNHCVVTGKVVRQLNFPFSWTSASDCTNTSDPSTCRSKP